MKKLKLAIIGQGRSGRNIHDSYLKSEANSHFAVSYVVLVVFQQTFFAPFLL